MLVLSRQRDETIMIGDEIEITVVDVRGDKVRLGISAPPRVAVHRKEVYEAIRSENERAAQMAGDALGTEHCVTPIRPGRRGAGSSPSARMVKGTGASGEQKRRA
ncbi:MAG: carbon storage regulator CsrA [Phycisphaerales bacterium]|nr:carbon storage regulator CsrA [Phycisphaerales bacterium]